MSKIARDLEEIYSRKRGPGAWAGLSQEVRSLAEALCEELEQLIDPLLHRPIPEGSGGEDRLEALVSKHVHEDLRWRGWWGVFSITPQVGPFQFGRTRLSEDARLRSVVRESNGRRDYYLSPKSYPMLLPCETRVVFRHLDKRLYVGFDLPGAKGPLDLREAGTHETLDFFLVPKRNEDRIVLDRLLARRWSALHTLQTPEQAPPSCHATLPAGTDSVSPLAFLAPSHALLRRMLRLPVSLFDGLPRCELDGQRLFWLSLPWPEEFDPTKDDLSPCLRINAALFSDRLPSALNAGMHAERILRCYQMKFPHAVFINRVHEPESGKSYCDRRDAAAIGEDTYSLHMVHDDSVLAELKFDEPRQSPATKTVEFEYVPLQEAPHDLGSPEGGTIDFESTALLRMAEVLDSRQFGAIASQKRSVWPAFSSALASRGRCVTRREIIEFLRQLDYMDLHRWADWSGAEFEHRVGRVRGRAGISPYIEISVPLRAGHFLSSTDREDAVYLLESRLRLVTGLNDCVKIAFV